LTNSLLQFNRTVCSLTSNF